MTESILTSGELDDLQAAVSFGDDDLRVEDDLLGDDDLRVENDLLGDDDGGMLSGEAILSPGELEALREAVDIDGLDEVGGSGDGVMMDGEGLPRFRFGEGRVGGAKRDERLAYVFDGAARALERRLSDVLETGVTATITFLKVTRFAEFRETFEVDVRELAMLGFKVAGQPGQGLLALEPEVVERVVEGLMGGASNSLVSKSGRRNFRPTTQLDLRVCQRVMGGFLEDVGEVWNPAEPLQTQVTGVDSSGVVAKVYEDNTPVVVGLIEVAIGRRLLGMVGVVMPRGAVDKLADPASHEEHGEGDPAALGPLAEELPAFELDVEVMVGSKTLSVGELLALSVGDVLFLDSRQGAIGHVQGVPRFIGVPGRKNGHKAICVAEVIDDAN
jgi:flagellar motor switch protein FliM